MKIKITVEADGKVLDTKEVEVPDKVDEVAVITDSNLNYVCPELCSLKIRS